MSPLREFVDTELSISCIVDRAQGRDASLAGPGLLHEEVSAASIVVPAVCTLGTRIITERPRLKTKYGYVFALPLATF
jgi:hypothetical protein